MRSWRFVHRFIKSESFRFKHDSLFELYGAQLNAPNAPEPNISEEQRNNDQKTCSAALESFSAATYNCPHYTIPIIRSSALENLCSIAHNHIVLNTRENENMWRHALDIFTFGRDNSVSWSDRFRCAFVLYRQEKFEKCLSLLSTSLNHSGQERHLSSTDLSAILKCGALLILSAEKIGRPIDLNQLNAAKYVLAREAKRKESPENERLAMYTALKLFWWSMDWAFQRQRATAFFNLDIAEWRALIPSQLNKHIFDDPFEQQNFEVCSLHETTPWRLHNTIQISVSSKILRTIFRVVVQEERKNPDFCIFGLAVEAATKMVKVHSDVKFSKYALTVLGTSLNPLSIASFGNTRETHEKAINLVSQMSGFGAYHAMRQLLFHRSSNEQRLLQEKYGDLIFHSYSKRLNWMDALSLLHSDIKNLKTSWRSELPHALRLLSDAGKLDEYFAMLLDYNAAENRKQNLCVASSLAQALRRSGTWWRAMEVMELISLSDAPEDECQEMFLNDACLQVLYALRSARKWMDALSFFLPLKSVIPEQGFRWLCSMVSELPGGAPWQKVLALLQSHGPFPEKFLTSLKCIHLGEHLPTDQRSLNFVVNSLVQQGSWKMIMEEAHKRSDKVWWIFVLQAALRSSDPLPSHFFSVFPEGVLCSTECGRLGFIVAVENGMLPEYFQAVKDSRDVTFEYVHIAKLVVHNTNQFLSDYIFRSITCVKYCVDILSWKGMTVRLLAEKSYQTTQSVAKYLNIPECRCREELNDLNEKIFVLKSPEGPRVSSDLVVYHNSDIILAYKPYGEDSRSFAAGVVKTLCKDSFFSAPFLLPSSCNGIILLYSPLLASKWVNVQLVLVVEISPLPGKNYIPILACQFVERYCVSVLGYVSSALKIKCICASTLSGSRDVLDHLKNDMMSEGWCISKVKEDTMVENEVQFTVDSMRVQYYNGYNYCSVEGCI